MCAQTKKQTDNRKRIWRESWSDYYILVLNETFNMEINKEIFRVKIIEDFQGPMRILMHRI